MAEVKTEQEPSIEEILESIRQIISEDDEAAPADSSKLSAQAEPPVPPPPPPPPKKQAVADMPPNVLELTDRVDRDVPLDLSPPADEAPLQAYDSSANEGEGLLSDVAAEASASAMSRLLAGNVAVERDVPGRVGNVTLEDMARDLMRPLIKSWLDQNLPRIVEKMVQKELEKVSRRAMH